MANVASPILPLRLYRYRNTARSKDALDQELDAIINNYLYCAEFSMMNDPMEGFYLPSSRISGDTNYKNALLRVADRKSNVGIACLCESCEDIIMWTHYAGNHQGMCVSYSTRRLQEGLPLDTEIVRVAYVDNAPPITSADLRNTSVAARKILSQKRYSWAYEREWRILSSKGLVQIEGTSAVMQIFLGSRIDPKSRHKILQRIKGTNIKAYAMRISDYDHEWEAINVASKASR